MNFITGAGGFLQTLIFGYGGLRLNAEELSFNGKLPLLPDSTHMYLHGIKYLGSSLNFNYTLDSVILLVDFIEPQNQLELVGKDGIQYLRSRFIVQKHSVAYFHFLLSNYSFKDGNRFVLPKTDFTYVIRSKQKTNCALPYDKIDLTSCKNSARSLQLISTSVLFGIILALMIF